MFTRRKLTIYTAYYVSGILFAWLCFDRRELIHAALVICVCIGVCRMMTAELAKGLAVSFLAGSLLMSAGYFRLLPDEELTEKYGEFECSVMSETVREDYISVYASTCVNDRERVFRINIYDDIPAKGNLTGTVIKVAGVPEIPDVMRNPGTFDYRLFLKGKGATYVLNADEVQYIGPAEGIRAALRRKLIEEKTEFLSRIGPEAGPYISGMLFGDTASIDEEEYDKFKANGTAHILAVSGLHVGFLLALLRVLTRKRRTPAVSSVLPAILVLYGEMTGWSVSTQRAVI
jgi:predicted membrane metal-binding protein